MVSSDFIRRVAREGDVTTYRYFYKRILRKSGVAEIRAYPINRLGIYYILAYVYSDDTVERVKK